MRWRSLGLRALIVLVGLAAGAATFLATPWRQLKDLDARLGRELAERRARPPLRRSALRGPAAEGDVTVGLVRILEAEQGLLTSNAWAIGGVVATAREGRVPLGLEALEPALARIVAGTRDALRAELVSADERRGGVDLTGAEAGALLLVLELATARARDRGDLAEAARLAADHWRLAHDLRRSGLPVPPFDWVTPRAGRLVSALIPRLDAPALERLASELELLSATAPEFAAFLERERLGECALAKAVAAAPVVAGEREEARSHVGRILWAWGRWRYADRARGDEVAARRPPREARVAVAAATYDPPLWEDLVEVTLRLYGSSWNLCGSFAPPSFDDALTELVRLRAARILVDAERFRRAHARWPGSVEQALGHAAGAEDEDPFGPGPLRVATLADGGFAVYSVGPDGRDDGGAVAIGLDRGLRFAPPEAR